MTFELDQLQAPASLDATAAERSIRFNNPAASAVYELALERIKKYHVLKIVSLEIDSDGTKRLILCNLWQIIRDPDGELSFRQFEFATESWQECQISELPSIQLLPFGGSTDGVPWASYSLPKVAIDYVFRGSLSAGAGLADHPDGKKVLVLELLRNRFLIPIRNSSGGLRGSGLTGGGKLLTKLLWEHFIDRSVIRPMMALFFNKMFFSEYHKYHKHRAGFLRHHRERKNLLPLLAIIDPKYWEMPDLFSRKIWCDSKFVETKGFRDHLADNQFKCFTSVLAWNWLRRQGFRIVSYWVNRSSCSPEMAQILASANFSLKLPALAFRPLFVNHWAFEQAKQPSRLAVLFLLDCHKRWKNNGYAALSKYCSGKPVVADEEVQDRARLDINLVLDYLARDAGEVEELRRGATWKSLVRDARLWHRELAVAQVQKTGAKAWKARVERVEIDGVIITGISTPLALFDEGNTMHHCVYEGYIGHCSAGRYEVYHLEGPGKEASTLTLSIARSPLRWKIHQLVSYANQDPCKVHKKVAKTFYRRVYLCEENKKMV